MQNKLKAVTTEVIETLHKSNFRIIMATGDNALTAVSVAKKCKLLDSNKTIFVGELSTTGEERI